jgi:hypothetical protein
MTLEGEMPDENQLYIESIARHLRGLGLTEHQIELVAKLFNDPIEPLRHSKMVGPTPKMAADQGCPAAGGFMTTSALSQLG